MSNSYAHALCEHVEGSTYRVIRKGPKHKMDSARRAAKRDYPDQSFCIFLVGRREIGALIS